MTLNTKLCASSAVMMVLFGSAFTTVDAHFGRFRPRCPIVVESCHSALEVVKMVRGGNHVDIVAVIEPDGGSETNLPVAPRHRASNNGEWKRLRMYLACTAIVSAWAITGTLFYSWFHDWPLSQAFFYAVDAGMSIGFCTDVKETHVASRAFTIVFILLGASCVGGALALFVKDIMEGAAQAANGEYNRLLEKDAFRRADKDGSGTLSLDEFRQLIDTWSGGRTLSDEAFLALCKNYDRSGDGVIQIEEFVGRYYRDIDKLASDSMSRALYSDDALVRFMAHGWEKVKALFGVEHRIYLAFVFWIALGVTWGVIDQKWDPITATHFAVSALATGGLTAPPVASDGILPARTSWFVGGYCLLGIPLFALTLGHFARVLVEGHVVAAERRQITKPLTVAEFDFAKSLCTTCDSVVHLSDFIVLQLLRQGKITVETASLIKSQFESLDTDHSGVLTLDQATAAKGLA